MFRHSLARLSHLLLCAADATGLLHGHKELGFDGREGRICQGGTARHSRNPRGCGVGNESPAHYRASDPDLAKASDFAKAMSERSSRWHTPSPHPNGCGFPPSPKLRRQDGGQVSAPCSCAYIFPAFCLTSWWYFDRNMPESVQLWRLCSIGVDSAQNCSVPPNQ